MSKLTGSVLTGYVGRSSGDMSTVGLARSLQMLNLAQDVISNRHKWRFFDRTGDLTLTAGTRTYVVTGFSEIDDPYRLLYFEGDTPNVIEGVMDEDRWWGSYYKTSTGDPWAFRFFNSQIELNLLPSTSFVTAFSPVTVCYRVLPTALENTTSSYSSYPERFENLLVQLATKLVLQTEEDLTGAALITGDIKMSLDALIKRDIFSSRNSMSVTPGQSERYGRIVRNSDYSHVGSSC